MNRVALSVGMLGLAFTLPLWLGAGEAGETAVLIIKLPDAGAELDINGFRPGDAGSERVFLTPKLAPGKEFVYKVKVTWRERGETRQDVRDAVVRAGGRTIVDFTLTPPQPPTKKIEPEIKKEEKVEPKPPEKKEVKPLTDEERRQINAKLEKLGFDVFIGNVVITPEIKGKEKEVYGLLAQMDDLHAVLFQQGYHITDVDLSHLAQLTQIGKIELDSDNITDKGLAVLKNLPKLEELVLSQRNATGAFLQHLANSPKLKRLAVSGNLDAKATRFLTAFPKLEELSLQFKDVQEADLAPLQALTELKSLSLFGLENVSDEAAAFLDKQRKLERLYFSGPTKLGDATMQRLSKHAALKSLSIGFSQVTDEGLKALSGLKALEHLDVTGANVSDAGLSVLEPMENLSILIIQGTKIQGHGLQHIAKAKKLSLVLHGSEHFTGQGLHHVVQAVNEFLDLSNSGITDLGLADIKKLTKVTSLTLPRYGAPDEYRDFLKSPDPKKFTDAGLKHVGEMAQLESLSFGGPGITDAGLQHLAGLKNLQALELTGSLANVKGAGLIHLKDLKNVKELDLKKTGLTDANVQVLKELKQIEKLSLPDTVTAKSLNALKELTHLKTLTLPASYTPAMIGVLEKALPKTVIEGP